MTTTALIVLSAIVCAALASLLAFGAWSLWEDEQPNGWSFALGTLSVIYWFLAGTCLVELIAPGVIG